MEKAIIYSEEDNRQETEEEKKLRLAMEKSERIKAERRKKALELAKLELEKKHKEKITLKESQVADSKRNSAQKNFREVKQKFLSQYALNQPSINVQKNYVSSFYRCYKLGESFTLKELKIFCYCIFYEPSLATRENLLFIVKMYLEFGCPFDATKTVKEFVDNNPQVEDINALKLEAFKMISDYEKGKKKSF